MISAIAQAANHSISLYNANIVLYLCYLYIFSPVLVLSMGTPGSDFSDFTRRAFLLPLFSWNGFGLYVWLNARSFGSQPECNAATKLIVLRGELSATGSGRVVSLGE